MRERNLLIGTVEGEGVFEIDVVEVGEAVDEGNEFAC